MGNEKQSDAKLRNSLQHVSLRQAPDLHVQFSLNHQPMANPVRRGQFQKDHGNDTWIAYVDSRYPEQDRWKVFAETLLLSCGLPLDKALNVRELLCCKIEDLPRELKNLDVAPETVQHLRELRPAHAPSSSPLDTAIREMTSFVVVQQFKTDAEHRTGAESGNQKPVVTDLLNRGNGSADPRGSASTSSSSMRTTTSEAKRGSSRPHPQKGRHAQEWLYDKLKEWCLARGHPEPDSEKDQIDITLNIQDQEFFIEAKRVEGSKIYWSERQIGISRDNPGRYFIALLKPNGLDNYQVIWIEHPLTELMDVDHRQVQWIWSPELGEELAAGTWEPLELRPSRTSAGYKCVVPVHGFVSQSVTDSDGTDHATLARLFESPST
jgi:hypothetical protein